MTALTSADWMLENKPAPWPKTKTQRLVGAGETLYHGGITCADPATGKWVEPDGTDPTLIAYGWLEYRANDGVADNSASDFTEEVFVMSDVRLVTFSGTALTDAHEGATAFIVDSATMSVTSNSGARPIGGRIVEVVSTTSAYVHVDPLLSVMLAARVAASTTQAPLLFSLYDFREVDSNSDVGDTTANGGILSSNTTPILRGNAAETQEISWATGNVDPIAVQKSLPADFDGTSDVTVNLWVYSGTSDAATFTVESGWDGGALVSDSASDSATKSATIHKITATIAAADIPNAAANLTLVLTPAAHATDTIQLIGMRLDYTRKLLTA